MSCAVCGAIDVKTALRIGRTEILECRECGLRWWTPPPDLRPERLYDSDYFDNPSAASGYDDYAAQEASLRHTFRRRLTRLGRPAPGARLLDVGAAFGYAVSTAQAMGWEAYGLELSWSVARRARGDARVAVAHGLKTPFADSSFDVITLWDVLEHLPQPGALLDEVHRLLRPGGRLALTTGDAGSLMARLCRSRWHLYTLPEHLFFYTRDSLRRLLHAHGMRVARMGTDASWYTMGYLVERLRKTLLGRTAKRRARWPGARLNIPVNLFDILLVHAVRND